MRYLLCFCALSSIACVRSVVSAQTLRPVDLNATPLEFTIEHEGKAHGVNAGYQETSRTTAPDETVYSGWIDDQLRLLSGTCPTQRGKQHSLFLSALVSATGHAGVGPATVTTSASAWYDDEFAGHVDGSLRAVAVPVSLTVGLLVGGSGWGRLGCTPLDSMNRIVASRSLFAPACIERSSFRRRSTSSGCLPEISRSASGSVAMSNS